MAENRFKLHAPFAPTGDQPEAIEALTQGVEAGLRAQTLLGVTGSGKTFTMANIIARLNRPTLVLAHNKTLAAQLCTEFREFFPENAVEFFVSYYDYYQPEAYIPGKDLYIEKDSAVNDEIDRLRHSATSALFERRDVIIVASVSCIYTLGDPAEYREQVLSLRPGQEFGRRNLIRRLTQMQYSRNDMELSRTRFRVRGDVIDIFPAGSEKECTRVEFFGDEIDSISTVHPVTGERIARLEHLALYPASHYVTSEEKREEAIAEIEAELDERVKFFESQGKLIEAQRISERVKYDLEMIGELGFCTGIENYSRVFARREPGSTPYTLLDYFPDDFVLFVDESHVTLPQVHGMSAGDRARKKNLVDYGFRLPSAFDNRPLYYEEFDERIPQMIFVSATPGDYELETSDAISEQLIRPTGLLDPIVEVRPPEGQIDDLYSELVARAERGERSLVLTLTKKMAEELTDYLSSRDVRVRYLHHNVETIERMKLLNDLRAGVYDVLVGINLLREGLDLPEVSLVAILDADKEGFLRSARSLIQIFGRAARHEEGRVILYASHVTDSMRRAMDETARRRSVQEAYNKKHSITPKTVIKPLREMPEITKMAEAKAENEKKLSASERRKAIATLYTKMNDAAKKLDFELAAILRDKIRALEQENKTE
ncbi:MAG: excinuclease ABC subunit UvrB [Clostridia bacterium]|nr:excinuclease ABC subunit UvrB [Clostridia bacterium]